MHRSLQITEILDNIFESYNDDTQGKSTLLNLALVCKIFHEPALDALWIFQRSFVTLLKTFPEDLWEEMGIPSAMVSKRSYTISIVYLKTSK
jgi:hypothetical protein